VYHLAILAAVAAATVIFVAIVAITVTKIVQWFRSRGKLMAEHHDAIAVGIATRLRNRQFAEVTGVFDGSAKENQLVQAIYDTKTGKILEARGLTSSSVDDEVVQVYEKGNGLVVYS